MSIKTRLTLCVVVLVGSAGYGTVVATDSEFASGLALSYVSLLLTVLILISFGRRKHDRH